MWNINYDVLIVWSHYVIGNWNIMHLKRMQKVWFFLSFKEYIIIKELYLTFRVQKLGSLSLIVLVVSVDVNNIELKLSIKTVLPNK